jgi:hypothetical protein
MMKLLYFISLAFLLTQIALGQTKVDEYERTDSDSEGAHIHNLLTLLDKDRQSTALIVVYSGEGGKWLADALRDIDGIKAWIGLREGNLRERITYQIAEKSPVLYKELWVYPDGVKPPTSNVQALDLGGLDAKYLWASGCADCDPSIPLLTRGFINLRSYADLLKRYPQYSGLIVLHPPASIRGWSKKQLHESTLEHVIRYRSSLNDLGVGDRVKIRIDRVSAKSGESIIASFYVVPSGG